MSEPSSFRVAIEQLDPSTASVIVSGAVDLATAAEFEDALAAAVEHRARTALLVDLTDMTFIDSTGLTALVRAFERQRLSGTALALVSDDARVAMILEVSRLDRILHRFPTRAQALEALARA
jgi:anti-sigma B factor antagonist